MWNKFLLSLLLGSSLALGMTPAHATPTVAIDMNPILPGIQSTLSVLPGSVFGVDVVITGIADDPFNPFDGVNGYELDVDYDSSVVAATGAASGGYLGFLALNFENDLTAPDVNFAEADIFGFGTGHFGDGVLVSMTFLAVGGGTSLLDLNDVLLSHPFGIPMLDFAISSGSVTVTPEPTSLLLFGSGIFGLGLLANRKARQSR